MTEKPEGYISYANVAAERIFGIPIADQIGYSVAHHPLAHLITDVDGRILPPKDWSVNFALRGETLNGREFMFTRPDGKKVVILASTAPLYTENGDITGAVSVYHDITERKSIEQHKNEFLSIASHELRTPITAIQGFAEILQLQASEGASLDSPQTLRAITNIAEQSQLLTHLIEEMLDISRIENARLSLDLAPHDILRTLKDVIESQTLTSKHHQLRLVLEGLEPNDTLIGNFDEDRTMQVFNNLISNAIKYSPARSEIEVGLRHTIERPDEVLVWVKDQGIGIPTEEIPRIFERFHRAGNLERSMSGLGIGLYLVKEIVTRHNGKVWAESSEGNGSTFYVLLPLKPTQH